MFHVLIVEDDAETSSLLVDYLKAHLPRLVQEPDQRTSRLANFKASGSEPGWSQLHHLRRGVAALEDDKRAGHPIPRTLPLVDDLDAAKLPRLRTAANAYRPGFGPGEEVTSEAVQLRAEVCASGLSPEILVIDLAMAEGEGLAMENAGCYDEYGEGDPASIQLRDPRSALRDTTGFKILRAFSSTMPVIVTSRMSNPIIAQHCLVNGAFAYVRKPRDKAVFENVTSPVWKMENNAREAANATDIVVSHYLTSIASEILKAVSYRYPDWNIVLGERTTDKVTTNP